MDIRFTRETPEIQSQPVPVVKRRWDRWLYIFILIIIFGSFLKWLIYPYFFDLSEGVLLQQQYDINFAEDIRIQEYFVEEGSKVKIGDTLFVYEVQNNRYSIEHDSVVGLLNQGKDEASLIELDAQIEKRRLLILEHRKRLNFWKAEKERKQQLVYLNVITPNELANVDRWIDDVSAAITSFDVEYKVLLAQKRQMTNHIEEKSDLIQLGSQIKSGNSYFISPVEGKIDRLRRPLHEVTYEKDIIASIIKPEYFVRAYIDMDKFNDFKTGNRVSVILPYKHSPLEGIVSRIFMVSESKDPDLFDDVLNEKLGVVMEIVPTEKDKEEWINLGVSSIPVKIRKFKIQI